MLAERYDAFLFDLDGVLYRGAEATPGAPAALARLRAAGKGLAFVTNNSSRTPKDVAHHLSSLGVVATPDEVETSSLVTASLLRERGVTTAFVVGETGLTTALREHGIETIHGEPDRADVVVVGWDRSADYAKLRTASLLVQRGASLVATNADPSFPAPDGRWPGAGALLAVIEITTGVSAEVIGKPHAPIFLAALERAGGGRPLVIGDRLDTDIAGAAALGWDSLLVLTGISTSDEAAVATQRPTHVGKDLMVLFDDA
jgi:HAD superfamily hydrolase (TIGR01457 family)